MIIDITIISHITNLYVGFLQIGSHMSSYGGFLAVAPGCPLLLAAVGNPGEYWLVLLCSWGLRFSSVHIVGIVDTTCGHPLYGLANRTFLAITLMSSPLQNDHQQPHCANCSKLQLSEILKAPTEHIVHFPDSLHNDKTKVFH